MKLSPAHLCCGCVSLTIGIEAICLLHLLACVIIVAFTSSQERLVISGIVVPPEAQVAYGAWAVIGMVCIVAGGIGALYRHEMHLRIYYYYLGATFFWNLFWWCTFLSSGTLCNTLVSKDVQQMGVSFVCGFMDSFVVFGMLLVGLFNIYCIFVVWSCAEQARSGAYPLLMKYSQQLKKSMMPLPSEDVAHPVVPPLGPCPPLKEWQMHPEFKTHRSKEHGSPPIEWWGPTVGHAIHTEVMTPGHPGQHLGHGPSQFGHYGTVDGHNVTDNHTDHE